MLDLKVDTMIDELGRWKDQFLPEEISPYRDNVISTTIGLKTG